MRSLVQANSNIYQNRFLSARYRGVGFHMSCCASQIMFCHTSHITSYAVVVNGDMATCFLSKLAFSAGSKRHTQWAALFLSKICEFIPCCRRRSQKGMHMSAKATPSGKTSKRAFILAAACPLWGMDFLR